MEYAGWEVVKMISDGVIYNGQDITAHLSDSTSINMVVNIKNNITIQFHSKDGNINYGHEWLYQPKSIVSFTLN